MQSLRPGSAAPTYAKQNSALNWQAPVKVGLSYIPYVGPILGGLFDLFSPEPEPPAPPPPPKEKFQLVQPQRQPFTPTPRPDISATMVQGSSPDRTAAFANMMRGSR